MQIFLANDEQSPAELMAEAEIDLVPADDNTQDLLVKVMKIILDQFQSDALPLLGYEIVRWSGLQKDAGRLLLQAENKHPPLVFASGFGKSCSRFNPCGGEVTFEVARLGDVAANRKPEGFDQAFAFPVSSEHYYCDESPNVSPDQLTTAINGQWLTYDAAGTSFKCRIVNPAFKPTMSILPL